MYVLQSRQTTKEANSKLLFTEFRRTGPYIVEKALPKNSFLVCKTITDNPQVPDRKRLLQFTPRKPIPDVQITPRELKTDPEVSIKHDGLYDRAWDCEYEKPNFDSDYNNVVMPNSPDIAGLYKLVADETSAMPGAIRESFPEFSPPANRSCDGTDTDHYMQPDADTSVEQPNPTPTNPRGSKYDLYYNPRPNFKDDYRY